MILISYDIEDIKDCKMVLIGFDKDEHETIKGLFKPTSDCTMKCSSCWVESKIYVFQAIKHISLKEFAEEFMNNEGVGFKQYYNHFLAFCEGCATLREI